MENLNYSRIPTVGPNIGEEGHIKDHICKYFLLFQSAKKTHEVSEKSGNYNFQNVLEHWSFTYFSITVYQVQHWYLPTQVLLQLIYLYHEKSWMNVVHACVWYFRCSPTIASFTLCCGISPVPGQRLMDPLLVETVASDLHPCCQWLVRNIQIVALIKILPQWGFFSSKIVTVHHGNMKLGMNSSCIVPWYVQKF